VSRGFVGLLDRKNIAFSVEVTDTWLRQTGSSAGELFTLMVDHGFSAYEPIRRRTGLAVHLTWVRVDAPSADYQSELLFAKTAPG
jgi:hypothetical protein